MYIEKEHFVLFVISSGLLIDQEINWSFDIYWILPWKKIAVKEMVSKNVKNPLFLNISFYLQTSQRKNKVNWKLVKFIINYIS